ncbi:hypothetical protein BDA96_04G175100 [Sorghum bicolor]|uniref:Uncharacterized protein n=2 Tax=Sorghum bicolor TaxID=4558 RepID=C5XTD3_SORBI|nr:uncharacterized protein LOC8059620 [Sorghum bicolor]EES06901.1 hypothetical protein SORBI_3004G163600 [Sorghum bicolor]KAG0533233.1 hypothetical protein BDA96_04G175100 [Sorghum bicolor]OQU85048.1 hypothetical protein SORBI_3004G163600 [Sorghum bicolor]|eukprot:XP_002453925.1 uncharacterized protein LOC8059620 [Sorghum bicolor]
MQQGDQQMMECSGGKEQQMQIVCVRSSSTGGEEVVGEWAAAEEQSSSRSSALSLFKEKEEEIERKKVEVRDKVFSMLGRVEEETKRLAFIRQELELMADPTRREVDAIRKRIDKVNKHLKPLAKTCLKKEKEYKMCLEAYNEKSSEKATLVNRLMELVSESERLRMKKLEELNKTIESLY